MGLVLSKGLPELFTLMESDESGETFVTVKPATVAENAQRDELWAKQSRTYFTERADAVEVKTESTFSQRRALEVYLTIVDCNIDWQDVDSEGAPRGEAERLFEFSKTQLGDSYLSMTREDFGRAWGRLPESVAREIHEKVLVKNPQWDMFQS